MVPEAFLVEERGLFESVLPMTPVRQKINLLYNDFVNETNCDEQIRNVNVFNIRLSL